MIQSQGPLSIAQFMTIALHDAAAGYYATNDPIGSRGDFVTAPEISQMFGELVGLWFVDVWHAQDKPKNARLVELGPGRGTLMRDLIRAVQRTADFLEGLDVVLVESSRTLRTAQQELMKPTPTNIRWDDRYVSDERPLFLIANEFFDALPVRQYVRTERGWCERMVIAEKSDKLGFALSPAASLIVEEREAPLGGVIEATPSASALVEDIGRTIAHAGGAALIIDYGYDRPGFGETLQAVGKHRFDEVLSNPGTVDISAHVNFPELAAAARRGGAETFGPVAQGHFLDQLGIRARASALARQNPSDTDALNSAVDRLTGTSKMGQLFKVLAVMPPNTPPPPGF